MTEGLVTTAALLAAFLAGRATLRRRGVLLLGSRGRELAPGVLASLWVAGLLVGQVTGSVTGMAVVGALALLATAALSRLRFAPMKLRRRLWSHLDWALFLFIAVLFWSVDLWDIECHRAITAQFLHGNIPPSAINDVHFPLAYHAVYDALVAVVLTAAPIDLQPAMAIVSIACVALTFTNLQALSGLLFQSPRTAQLGRALFVLGFGPVIIRSAASGWDLNEMHGHTAQAYIDLILRRPAGLGFAFFTLAFALILPCYAMPGEPELARRRAVARLCWLIPTLALIPQMAEEAVLPLFVLLAPLALRKRLPARMILLLVAATLLGAVRSGVVLGVLGHRAMATPMLHLAWPPRLPTWAVEQTGVPLLSRQAAGFYGLELGPVFLSALALALVRRDPRRRLIGLAFLVGATVAIFANAGEWKKSDLDRFFFYGTPPVFMLAADLPEWFVRAARGGHSRPPRTWVLAAFGLLVCGPTTIYPGWQAGMRLREGFRAHDLRGDLGRNLSSAGPREPILTTLERSDELVMAGFMVIAPMDTNSIARVTAAHFDEYVRANASRAVWLFLPERDARVAGRPTKGRDRDYVLVRAAPSPPATRGAGSR